MMVVVCDKTGGGASSDAPIGPIHRQLLPVQYSTYLDTYFDLKYFPLSSHSLQFSHGLTSGCYGPSLCTWKLVSALSRMGVSRIHCMSRRDSRHDSLASASHISSTTATSTFIHFPGRTCSSCPSRSIQTNPGRNSRVSLTRLG